MTAESETETMRAREFTEALRLEARAGWTKAVANHFSVAVAPGSPRARFNPSKNPFLQTSRHRRSSAVDSSVDGKIDRPEKLDPTAPAPQSPLHQNVSYARCVIQAHAIHATVLACLVHSRMPVNRPEHRRVPRLGSD